MFYKELTELEITARSHSTKPARDHPIRFL